MFETWLTAQWQRRGWFAWLLLPVSLVFNTVTSIRKKLYQWGLCQSYRAPVPVVVVGNIYVGGTGKTPVILSLISALQSRGWHPGLISRGYGSSHKKQPACGTGVSDARIFGDEPAMISHKTGISISVHPKRGAACEALLRFDPKVNVILSDDGLQHWALARDIELLVQDERGCGNGFLLPAGPLRESPRRLKQVDAVLTRATPDTLQPFSVTTSQCVEQRFTVQVAHFVHLKTGVKLDVKTFVERFTDSQAPTKPSSVAPSSVTPSTHHSLPALFPALAIAGIGVPERFFSNLRQFGIPLQRTLSLGDHSPIDLSWLTQQPERTILMTEKDAVRLMQSYDSATVTLGVDCQQAVLQPTEISRSQHANDVDPRIWIGVADTHWPDEHLFDWLDQRLHNLKRR